MFILLATLNIKSHLLNNFVSVHVVRDLGWDRVSGLIKLDDLFIEAEALPGGEDHEDDTGADAGDTDVETGGEEGEESNDDQDLELGPDTPCGKPGVDGVSSLASVELPLLGKHLGGLGSGEENAHGLTKAGGSGEELGPVVGEHHGGVDEGGGNDGEEHVGGESQPLEVIVSEGGNEDVLGVSGHGKGGSDVRGGGEGEKVGKGVGDLVADAKVNDNTGEDEDDGVVHHGGGSNGGLGDERSEWVGWGGGGIGGCCFPG